MTVDTAMQQTLSWFSNTSKLVVLATVVLLLTGNIALAAPPDAIVLQGRLSDAQGLPYTGNYDLKFKLYTMATGGVPIWTEIHNAYAVTNGIYSVYLGTITPLTGLTFDTQYWVGLEVNNDGEMTPRSRLSSAAYCFRARYADTAAAIAGGGRVVGTLTVTDTITAGHFVGDGSGLTGVGLWQQDGGGISYSAGRVGINTETPTTALDINGVVRATSFAGLGTGLTGMQNTFSCTTPPNISWSSYFSNIPSTTTVLTDAVIWNIPANTVKNGALVCFRWHMQVKDDNQRTPFAVEIKVGNDGTFTDYVEINSNSYTASSNEAQVIIPSINNDWTVPTPIRIKLTWAAGHKSTTAVATCYFNLERIIGF